MSIVISVKYVISRDRKFRLKSKIFKLLVFECGCNRDMKYEKNLQFDSDYFRLKSKSLK